MIGANKDETTPLGKLMHDFFCTNPDDMYYKVLAERVRYFKENDEGVNTMCRVLEEMRFKAAKEAAEIATAAANKAAAEKAAREAKAQNVKYIQTVMRRLSYTVEEAMEFLEIPMEQYAEYFGAVSTLN